MNNIVNKQELAECGLAVAQLQAQQTLNRADRFIVANKDRFNVFSSGPLRESQYGFVTQSMGMTVLTLGLNAVFNTVLENKFRAKDQKELDQQVKATASKFAIVH